MTADATRGTDTEGLARLSRLADAGLLASGVMHDLANTLMAVQMHCHDALEARAGSTAESVRRALRTAAETARTLRAYGAFVRGANVVESTDVRTAIEGARALWAPMVERGRVDVVTECMTDVVVDMNEALLQQVLINLVLNAHAAIGGERGVILVRGGRTVREAWIEVCDDGPGVPIPLRERLFRPFESRADRPRTTGLGLYMARRLFDAHGGALVLKRTGQSGTTFRLTLPLA